MIIGTAGHIDHGKTTLVKALTGVDTDRLPEEKKRGISIELGYAFLSLPGLAEPIGFIDVPGHERLVHTMLAGASGMGAALLLVAADDGPMPQTREHLAVLSLLGIAQGAVVITKADRVGAERLAQVQEEAKALVAGTSLAQARQFVVAAHTGQGIAALRAAIGDWARAAPSEEAQPIGAAPLASQQAFRLAIDRIFTLDGVGTVATGTVHAGQLRVGQEVLLTPSARTLRFRVRSLHVQGQALGEEGLAVAGQRCAVGLAGAEKPDLERGQWLLGLPAQSLAPAHMAALHGGSQRLDARVHLWPGEAKPLRPGTAVHVHIGAASTTASLAVLQASDASDALAPGAQGLVQLVLHKPLGAWVGDRIVLRDASASRTVAGGRVLDPFAPTRYRRTPERLAELAAMGLADAHERLAALSACASQGLDLERWARAHGHHSAQSAHDLAPTDQGTNVLHSADGAWALASEHLQSHQQATLAALQAFHTRSPEELGPDTARLRRLAAPRLAEPLWRALLAHLRQAGRLQLTAAMVHLPEHGVKLSATEQRIAQKVQVPLNEAGFEGAWARDLAKLAAEPEALLRTTLARLAQRGELHQVVRDLFYPQATMSRLAQLAREVGEREGEVKAASFRDATGLGRKRAIQILEYFDKIGLLRRVGDSHKLRPESQLFAAQSL